MGLLLNFISIFALGLGVSQSCCSWLSLGLGSDGVIVHVCGGCGVDGCGGGLYAWMQEEALLMESRVEVTVCVYSESLFNGLVGA